jgi:hypothetical protein
MDPHIYYILAVGMTLAGMIFHAGQRLQRIEGKLDPLKDVPDRLTKVEVQLEVLSKKRSRPRRR